MTSTDPIGTVETVLGPVDPTALGAVDAHEHLFLRTPALPGDDFHDLDQMAAEAADVRRSGIATIVELTPVGLGRDPRKLAELSRRTGVHVVASTGFHRDAHYPAGHWVYREPVETLVEVLTTDLVDGMDARDWQGPVPDPTPYRAGVVKVGGSYQQISAAEARRFTAGGQAAARTGVAVAVHCEVGTTGHEALDRLADAGLPSDRVMLAHLDRNPDPALHAALATRGAYLLYDTVGRVKYRPESALIALIADLVAAGHGDRILLGTDVGRRGMLRAYGGGPGMDVLGTTFLPRLVGALGQPVVDRIMHDNPARVLTRRGN
ncbi:phosphotriesterase family protein [Plantactinospora soyae]|uniref:Phosphotriesterase-related protein n=1 Tax=Plantactinospora soyae TaxID=1544732 RepID=A0A927M8D6_9ACTN|nr:amidohydrolase family protein [Plantactinospora soyae]MBE1489679.1 phosphotriesterase-related protein [Plantactinospora soyae]